MPRVVIAAFAAGGLLAVAAAAQETPQAGEGPSCLEAQCHAYRMAFSSSPHSALDTEGVAAWVGEELSCAACHGEIVRRDKGEDEPGCEFSTFAFRDDDPPATKSEKCLACHRSTFPRFSSTSHGQGGMDCTTCHEVHGNDRGRWPLQRYWKPSLSELRSEDPSSTCRECHDDIFAEFSMNESHRLREGILHCTSCHDPHEPPARWRLGGFDGGNCGKCHRRQTGPYVYEHQAVRFEGCPTCHRPHGSPNRHLLAFQEVAELCLSCHALVPGFHSRFTSETVCTNCHSSIHGSNLDPFFLK